MRDGFKVIDADRHVLEAGEELAPVFVEHVGED